MKKNWMPITAGIFEIICCLYAIIQFRYVGLGIVFFLPLAAISSIAILVTLVCSIPIFYRKYWLFAFIGSISSIVACIPIIIMQNLARSHFSEIEFILSWCAVVLGAFAVILMALSRKQFERKETNSRQVT